MSNDSDHLMTCLRSGGPSHVGRPDRCNLGGSYHAGVCKNSQASDVDVLESMGTVALAVLVGGVGVAAGGLEIVKGWFGRVELVSPDGESKSFNVQGVEVFDDRATPWANSRSPVRMANSQPQARSRLIVHILIKDASARL